jgi:hypothetical protein
MYAREPSWQSWPVRKCQKLVHICREAASGGGTQHAVGCILEVPRSEVRTRGGTMFRL